MKKIFFAIYLVLALGSCTGGSGDPDSLRIDAETLEGHKKKPVVASFKTEVQLDGSLGVKIFGENFKPLAKVDIKKEPCKDVEVHSSMALSCKLAEVILFGIEDIIVTNPDGLKNTPLEGNAAPALGSISPTSGGSTGGTVVTLTGTGFIQGAIVQMGGSECTSAQVVDSTTLTCTTPSHSVGLVDVQITNPDAKSGSLSNAFTYVLSDVWRATSTVGAPTARVFHTAVWTGSNMIVWGGMLSGGGSTNTGGIYDPATNTWTPTTLVGAPLSRRNHQAVWTGSRMLVWGGMSDVGNPTNTGGAFDPVTNTWTLFNNLGAPSGRVNFTAVWTGSRMLVWGGEDLGGPLPTGGSYNPVLNQWASIPAGILSPRRMHSAVWTGTHMIIWGGNDFSVNPLFSGGMYDPSAGAWTLTNVVGAPSGRQRHASVWTGSKMIIWGGNLGLSYDNTGSTYDPILNQWTPLTIGGDPPTPGEDPAAAWTGSKLLIWSPYNGVMFPWGGAYDLIGGFWRNFAAAGVPAGRSAFPSVWTGSEMIVWGGNLGGGIYANSGGIYTP